MKSFQQSRREATYRSFSDHFSVAGRIGLTFLSMFCGAAFSNPLENEMQKCGWDRYSSLIEEFRKHRSYLPKDISVSLLSCSLKGPTYKVKTDRRTVLVQDGWNQDNQSTVYFFSKDQPSDRHWQFKYQGYEWNGYVWINRTTGQRIQSPGNQCGEISFSAEKKKALVVCSPEYATDTTELFLISFSEAIAFKRLQKNPPSWQFDADWSAKGQAKVTFRTADSTAVRQYKY